jgi:poly(hydroxyalkanoate) depolymerase family esterase
MHRSPLTLLGRPCLRRTAWAIAGAAVALTSGASVTFAGSFSGEPNFGSNPGNLKMFKYLPDRLPDPAPLVVVLHGCRQSAKGYLDHSGWAKYADQGGFALLLPEQQIGPGPVFFSEGRNHLFQCFNFAELRDSRRDSGEALSIKQMIDRMKAEHGIDPNRIFVTGLSAGGGMTAVMMAAYPDVFASGAVIAGLPYRCGTATRTSEVDCGVTLAGQSHKPAPQRMPEEWGRRVREAAPDFRGSYPRVSIWQGTADKTVDPPNARELVEQWTNVHGIDQTPDEREDGSNYTHLRFKDAQGNTLVESYELRNFGHATPIDPDGSVEPCGSLGDQWIVDGDICSTQRIARFWGLLGVPPTVTITEVAAQDTAINVSGTTGDADGTVTEVAVLLDGPAPQPSRTASGTATWSVSFDNLPNDEFYTPVVTVIDNGGLRTTVRAEPVPVGTPPRNQPPQVAVIQAKAERDCVTVDGRAIDPDGRVTEVAVKLGSRSFRPATLSQEGYSFQECQLPDGTYTTEVRATDDLEAQATVNGPPIVIQAMVPAKDTWQGHMMAGRLRIYQAPCPSVGFGACDAAFPAILQEHGFSPFDLFRRATSNDWFVNPGNIP